MKALALKVALGLMLSLGFAPIAHAALTVHGENDEAIHALDADSTNWMVNHAAEDCASGAHLLESAVEFAQTPTLDVDQRAVTFSITQSLAESFHEACSTELAKNP